VVPVVRAFAASALLTALLTGLVTGCSGDTSRPGADLAGSTGPSSGSKADDEKFQPTDEDRSEIRALLRSRAQALQDGDRTAFMATVDTRDPRFVRQQRTLFANLQLLPVESVSYSVDDASGYPTAKVKGDDPLFRPDVLEQVDLEVDEHAVTNQLEDTFVRRDNGWLLGAESLPGKYHDAHEPQSRPWAGGVPIAVASSSGLLMVVDRARAASVQELADQMVGYVRFAADALDVEPSFDVLVDATTVGEVSKMNTVDDAEAAATTSPVGFYAPGKQSRLAGMRIKVNPETAVATVGDERVMRHELTHYLTVRRMGGAPTWLKEGLAEWVSTAPATLDGLVLDESAYQHLLDADRRLPTSGRWGLDPLADYLVARAAVTHIIESDGVDMVFELAQGYAEVDGDDPDVKTPRVLKRVLGITEAALVRDTWADLTAMRHS
jgi:hypothetical protein